MVLPLVLILAGAVVVTVLARCVVVKKLMIALPADVLICVVKRILAEQTAQLTQIVPAAALVNLIVLAAEFVVATSMFTLKMILSLVTIQLISITLITVRVKPGEWREMALMLVRAQ